MAKKAIPVIEVENGPEITRFSHLTIEQKLFEHHEFSIQVPLEAIEGEGNFTFAKSKELIGKPIRISINSDLILDVSSPPFRGIITKIGFVRSLSRSNEVVIKGQSTSIITDNGRNYRSFSEKTLADIVEEIMGEYPGNLLSCKPDPTYEKSIPYIVQYNESDFNFLHRLGDRFGQWIYYNGSDMIFGKPELPDAIPLLLGRDLYDFNINLSLIPTSYESHFYNYEKSEVYRSASSKSEINNYDVAYGKLAYQESKNLFQTPVKNPSFPLSMDQKDLDGKVNLHVDQLSSGMVYFSGNSDHIGLGIGCTINVTGTKSEDAAKGTEDFGEFIITNIKHYLGGDGDYYNSFDAIPKEVGIPPSNLTLSQVSAEPEPAIIKENIDPQKLGRVRVQFYWQTGNEMTPWIRLVSSHGGKTGGFYVIPEKGDEIMAGYEHNHPDKPFVYGSIYNYTSKPADNWIEDKNNIKAIKTKSGNEIIFNDKEGHEEIKILNKGGPNSITLTMSSGGSISISTNNQMNLSGKNITITAEEDFKVNAKNILLTTKEDINAVASRNISVHSASGTSITSGGNALMASAPSGKDGKAAVVSSFLATQAGEAIVAGKAGSNLVSSEGDVSVSAALGNAKLEAKLQVNLNGEAMTNVGSKGPVIVNGSIVQLN